MIYKHHTNNESDSNGQTANPQKKIAVLFFDGAAKPNPGRAAAAAILLDEHGETLGSRMQLLEEGNPSNNDAEHVGLCIGLELALELGATHVQCYGDSQLVINQAFGTWRADRKFLDYIAKQRALAARFDEFKISHIPGKQNVLADTLSKNAPEGNTEAPAAARTTVSIVVTIEASPSVLERHGGTRAIRKTVETQLQKEFGLAVVKATTLNHK